MISWDVRLGPVYHWSPSDRRDQIRTYGLVPGSEPQVSTHVVNYACFGTSPAGAWSLSGGMEWLADIEEWDLWQATLVDTDEVHFRSEWGPLIREVRVVSVVPPDRLWLAGTRRSSPA